jgi:two-component system cell cycle sensor histidine kinase/response regulator CckA
MCDAGADPFYTHILISMKMKKPKEIRTPGSVDRSGRILDSNLQLALSIDRMPLGYIVWDADFHVLEWNPAAEKIFGWSGAEAKGKQAGELMLPGAESPPECMRRALQQGEKTTLGVCAGVNKAGKRVVCEWHNTPVLDEARNVRGVISMVNDITGRDETDRELRESRKFLQTIIDTEPECIKLIDAEGNLIMMNRAGLDMIEADSLNQVKGQSVCTLVTAEHREAFSGLTEKVFRGESGTLDFEMQGMHGRKLWLETHGVPLRNDKDEIIALLGITRDITKHKEAEEALRREKSFSDAIIDNLPGIFFICDEEGRLIRWNNNEVAVTGYSGEELGSLNVLDLFRKDRDVMHGALQDLFATGRATLEARLTTKNGSQVPFFVTGFRMITGDKRYLVAVGIDVSERKRLEEQLRQAQKMESIGTLAGGIAHDFNNILTAIIGYGSLLEMKMKEGDPLRYNVEQVLSSANRAASLTQGLLAYSRKQILNPQPVSVNAIIQKVDLLLSRLIGENIDLKIMLTDDDVTVLADAGQIEQVLMNLATNARDAMSEGGYLFIETERLEFSEESAKVHEFGKPGTYALITVTDSGMGMDENTRQRIFEPFFTTKDVGQGTGLGLAIAYGIVKQHNGTITVYSEEGRGTTFKIYLPVVPTPGGQARPLELPPIPGGNETVLVAEDDEIVRKLTRSVLEQFGYAVIEAEDGEDAVNKFMKHRDVIKLLLFDVIMPKKSGREAYEKIRIFSPDMKVLFLSGYTAEVIQRKGLLEPGLNFIMKPVPMNELLRKVRSILDNG